MNSRYLIATAIAFALPAAAHADEGADEEIVVLASGFEQPADATGQAIAIIGRERLDQLQSVTIGDALRSLPSLNVAQRGPVGAQSSVFVRGGNSSQTLVLVDGVRANDPSSPNAAFDFGGLLAGNVERIEVLRGPNSIIWGSQAIGGVVNIETARPQGPLRLRASAEYGAYDTVNARANLTGSSGAVGFSLGGAFYRTDGYSIFSGGNERDGSELASLNGRVLVTLSDALSLDLRTIYSDTRSAYDSEYSGGANSLAGAHNRQWFAYAGLNLDLADGRFRSRLAYSRSDIDRVGTDPVVFSFNNYIATGLTDRVEYRGQFELSPAISLVGGLEYEHIRSSTAFEGAVPDQADNDVTGGYLQASLRPLAGLTITGGVRHDIYSDYGAHTTLGGNLAYSPNEGKTVIRATYGEGFRAPTLTEGQPPYGNPDLKPETARNLDLGIEQNLVDGRLALSLTWFQRRSTNLIAFSGMRSENIGRAESEGVEATLVMRPTDRLRVEAGYARVNAFNRSAPNDGKRLPLRPADSASFSADWEAPFGLKLGATIWLVGDSFDNAANTVRNEGYSRIDLRAAMPVGDAVELFGRIDNLGDARYQTVSGYNTPGRSAFVGARIRI
ncbi:TonB-dependent siderophore receptor [Novosphingobium sp. TH158]|uniref:TonB-dependent receptor plug domain-containing protein n=1 Tax=Novosphingobium sp. TH158 TaxID=2067455 RepID=UPI0013044C4A|nr:TonB-dependent receptor [Novosphingobium sp. TH158]